MKRVNIVCLVLLLLISGCAKHKQEKTAEQLAAEGIKYFENENYTSAIKSYEKLRDWYPFSKHAKDAELKIADSHYRLEDYEEAIVAYKEFERMHPSDENAPYVIYQVGRCYFDRIGTIDTDASPAQEALDAFRLLQEKFPDHDYAKQAEPHIEICLNNIAGHEMYVAKFYFKSEKYNAAMHRFMGVVADFPDTEFYQEAKDYIDQCQALMAKDSEQALPEIISEPAPEKELEPDPQVSDQE